MKYKRKEFIEVFGDMLTPSFTENAPLIDPLDVELIAKVYITEPKIVKAFAADCVLDAAITIPETVKPKIPHDNLKRLQAKLQDWKAIRSLQ